MLFQRISIYAGLHTLHLGSVTPLHGFGGVLEWPLDTNFLWASHGIMVMAPLACL